MIDVIIWVIPRICYEPVVARPSEGICFSNVSLMTTSYIIYNVFNYRTLC
jgi:hypothetical protein